ncbi:hypothetical protein HBH56_205910 [Parastagonospora nodorum]|nr:hypothetical protein HBH56_205910 [Parastagonospora nodorum]KAH3923762.1 hypothetical protein HBH54_204780 [Parastagonospora nodorum]KAH4062137.1 hypothetical protein HBH50_210080 [Parastagonospora nodorum]KAH4129700.1 hypothetical protein HBH45_202910 [Parastagonospora nodorum]KAH4149596.1 hypothetical protein HBH44_192120 [Parastagonospora nodorum]
MVQCPWWGGANSTVVVRQVTRKYTVLLCRALTGKQSQYRRRMKYLLVLNVCGSFATQLRSAGDWVAGCRCGGFTIG